MGNPASSRVLIVENEATFDTYRKQPGVMMEQSSRSTLQVLVKTGT